MTERLSAARCGGGGIENGCRFKVAHHGPCEPFTGSDHAHRAAHYSEVLARAGETPERALRFAMEDADRRFESTGGTTRHYVDELLIPLLRERGFQISPIANALTVTIEIEPFETRVARRDAAWAETEQSMREHLPDYEERSANYGFRRGWEKFEDRIIALARDEATT